MKDEEKLPTIRSLIDFYFDISKRRNEFAWSGDFDALRERIIKTIVFTVNSLGRDRK